MKTLPCGHCASIFKYKKDLNAHIKLQHGNGDVDKHFKCKECDATYVHQKSLKDHMKLKHGEGQASFVCPVCGKRLGQKKALNRHLLLHD